MSFLLPKCLIAAALLLGLVPMGAAGAVPGGTPLSLEEALRMAEARNLALRAAKQTIERADSVRRQALAANWPTLSVGSSSLNQGMTVLQGGLDIGYSLDTHGERSARIALAENRARASRYDYMISYQGVRLDTIKAYYDVLEAAEQVRISKTAVQQAQMLLADTQALKQGGEGTIFELQRAEVQVARARQSEAEAGGAYQVARRTLARILALEGHVEWAATDPVQLAGQWKPDLQESVRLAYSSRLELKLLDLRYAAAETQQTLAKSAYGINTQLFASAEMKSAVLTSSRSLLSLDSTLPGTGPGYMAGARLSWNAFDGGASREAAEQARTEALTAGIMKEDAKQTIRLEVERTFYLMQAGRQAVDFAQLARDMAREGVESARLRLTTGFGTQTDLILAQTDLVQAELSHAKAILNYNRALATMESVCLQPSPRDD